LLDELANGESMTLCLPQSQSLFGRLFAFRRFAGLAWPAAILLAAVASQVLCGAIGDVSWLITVDEHWLTGARPYVDIIETDPPGALLLYLPAAAIARLTGLKAEALVAASGFAVAIGSLALSAAVLTPVRLNRRLNRTSLGLALVATTVLPGRAFDERDFFAALFGLPLIAIAAARASRGPVGFPHALAAGVGAGAMIAVKPPYALVLVALAPYLLTRLGLREALAAVEFIVAAVVAAAFVAAFYLVFPEYVTQVAPVFAEAYLPQRLPLAALAANAGVLVGLVTVASIAACAGSRALTPLVLTPMVAAFGAFAAYFVQGKGWLYQAYPGLAYLTFAFAAALPTRPADGAATTAMAAVGLVSALLAGAVGRWPVQIGMAAAIAGFAIYVAFVDPRAFTEDRPRRQALGRMAAAAGIGVLAALFLQSPHGESDPAMERALKTLGPHPTVAALSESLAVGHPLTRRVGAVWSQRTQGLTFAAAARFRAAQTPGDADLAARMEAAIASDRDMLVEDIVRNRPDAILVGPTNTRFHAWVWADPKIVAAMTDYRLLATNDDKATPLEIWARKDFFPPLPSPPAAPAGRGG